MTLRILAVGDIHLGRRAGSVPADVADAAGGLEALGPRAAWRKTVEKAIELGVQAVVLLGDVVDDEERYLEGWSELETGVRKLLAARIEVVAVAGNHDVRVLPDLVRTLSAVRLIGAGGRWEALELAGGAARLVGWSYPTAHAGTDPTIDKALDDLCRIQSNGPTIGLLHGDLDASQSRYARFTGARLASAGADAWLLGHVHAPTFALEGSGRVPVGYLGSLTALDPTECGVHGPWLLEFEGRRLAGARQIPLAPLRREFLSIAVDAWAGAADLHQEITGALQAFETRERARLGDARAVGLRVDLVGRTPFHRELRAAIRDFDYASLRPTLEGRAFFVDRITDRARPALDLATIARANDPPALLARRLIELDAYESGERARLLRLARDARESLVRREFVALGVDEPSDEDIVDELRAAGLAALEDLLATRAESEARA